MLYAAYVLNDPDATSPVLGAFSNLREATINILKPTGYAMQQQV
jgi:hypothetical protein